MVVGGDFMDYSKYKKSRNLSWQILLNHNITSLPVQVSRICKNLGIAIISYSDGAELIYQLHLEEHCKESDGFIFQSCIFYNSECSVERQRFTVAHELGHILLHNGKGVYNREPSPTDIPIEQEANVFASRLLAPACVLWGMNIVTAEQISQICNISLTSAEFRMERMKLLYQREQDFISRYNKSCFLMSPLERQVYEKFYPYIQAHKSSLY